MFYTVTYKKKLAEKDREQYNCLLGQLFFVVLVNNPLTHHLQPAPNPPPIHFTFSLYWATQGKLYVYTEPHRIISWHGVLLFWSHSISRSVTNHLAWKCHDGVWVSSYTASCQPVTRITLRLRQVWCNSSGYHAMTDSCGSFMVLKNTKSYPG